jgi:hypothetical protein
MSVPRIRVALVAAVVTATVAASPALAANPIVIGASGDYTGLKSHVGGQLALHRYGSLAGKPITDAALVNIEPTVSWASIANGSHDADIRAWANAMKGKGTRLVSFSHEPMAKQNIHFGNASTFIAAWKHVVSVFDQAGATNVEWVWNVTSNSFRVSSGSSEYGAKWYPGDSWVDDVAGEAYNRYRCGFSSPKSLADQIAGIFRFAQQHNKPMVIAEFASNAYAGRAAWLQAAHAFVDSHKSDFRGAFYYQSTNDAGGCHWQLTTSSEFAALRAMVQDAGFTGTL